MSQDNIWKKLAEDKRRKRDALIPKDWLLTNPPPLSQLDVTQEPEKSGLLSRKEIEITNLPVEALLPNIANKKWSAVEVVTAFAKRAIIAHQLTNCLTEIFIDRALERAAWLDEEFKRTGKVVGPLHGLPISLKDQVCIKGIENTIGYTSRIGKVAELNSVLADILESQGAVLYVKTNVPQTVMWPEAYNHIFGRTANPYNRSLTTGGSSGGEGALIALKGSPLGVGSDIGGSVRVPAAFNGLYGFRPSCNRVPYAGCVNTLDGQESILSVLGPMSSSMEGIRLFMKNVVSAQSWNSDPMVLRMKWSEDAYRLAEHGNGGQLCFAIQWHDQHTFPHPPVIRALEIVKNALILKGHRVIDWKPFKDIELYAVKRRILGAAGTEDYLADLAPTGEPLLKGMEQEPDEPVKWPQQSSQVEVPSLPSAYTRTLTAYELWHLQKVRRELRREYLEHWQGTLNETGTGRPVDAIISPVSPFVAPPHGMNKCGLYAGIWNTLDCPALAIPVTKTDPLLDAKRPPHKFFNDLDRVMYNFYDPDRFANAPVSVQVVGRSQEDEAVLRMGEIVDKAVKEVGEFGLKCKL
ncbi:hypothetical protein M378DRAFT_861123 [Amanita muscaria Koide BX008]|uniref:amidase n=1 Tax=Amanita muscaria (strain Koide BX008) TaxID=946122 RepID=A0A0C2WY30_AMAMK|nr:hypothetical protein M378DRAFT_861123 [Amanita muscaria Koide BX008]